MSCNGLSLSDQSVWPSQSPTAICFHSQRVSHNGHSIDSRRNEKFDCFVFIRLPFHSDFLFQSAADGRAFVSCPHLSLFVLCAPVGDFCSSFVWFYGKSRRTCNESDWSRRIYTTSERRRRLFFFGDENPTGRLCKKCPWRSRVFGWHTGCVCEAIDRCAPLNIRCDGDIRTKLKQKLRWRTKS